MTKMKKPKQYQHLDADKVELSIEKLGRRVTERFPKSGLSEVCAELLDVSERAKERAQWIAKPILWLRASIGGLILVMILGAIATAASLPLNRESLGLIEFIQVLESGINDLVLIGAGIFFLATIETRIKRERALAALHELRSIAHIIDMHQLTKDPERVMHSGTRTEHSPKSTLTSFELGRYLEYCSEMLSMTGKVAAIYVEQFEDSVALDAVNEVEALTTGLSRKIWQKIMILYSLDPGIAPAAMPSIPLNQ